MFGLNYGIWDIALYALHIRWHNRKAIHKCIIKKQTYDYCTLFWLLLWLLWPSVWRVQRATGEQLNTSRGQHHAQIMPSRQLTWRFHWCYHATHTLVHTHMYSNLWLLIQMFSNFFAHHLLLVFAGSLFSFFFHLIAPFFCCCSFFIFLDWRQKQICDFLHFRFCKLFNELFIWLR